MRSAAWLASHKSFSASACIDRPALSVYALAEERVRQAAARHQVNRPAEQRLKPLLEGEIGLGIGGGRHVVELDQEIEVARDGVEVIPNCRAKRVKAARASAATSLRLRAKKSIMV